MRYQGRRPQGLSRLRAAPRLHVDELASATSRRISTCYGHLVTRRDRAGRDDQDLLRRVFRGARPHAEFYLETVDCVFQEALLAQGRTRRRRAARSTRGHPPHRAAHGRGRARRHLRHRPDRPPRTTCARASSPTASATTCRPASAITAYSAAGAGTPRSIRSCAIQSSRASRIRSSSFMGRLFAMALSINANPLKTLG